MRAHAVITWEGKDGLDPFRPSETHGGENVEEIKGVAALDGIARPVWSNLKPRRLKANLPIDAVSRRSYPDHHINFRVGWKFCR